MSGEKARWRRDWAKGGGLESVILGWVFGENGCREMIFESAVRFVAGVCREEVVHSWFWISPCWIWGAMGPSES